MTNLDVKALKQSTSIETLSCSKFCVLHLRDRIMHWLYNTGPQEIRAEGRAANSYVMCWQAEPLLPQSLIVILASATVMLRSFSC